MKKLIIIVFAALCNLLFVQCSDYLETSTPANTDDGFVTSSPSEAFKILSKTYADYRQSAWYGTYRYNDPFGSDDGADGERRDTGGKRGKRRGGDR